jgi:hypothetical protein
MIIQLNRTKFFLFVFLILHFVVFYNNYYLLINGKITSGKITGFYHYGGRSKYQSAIIKFEDGNYIYTISGQSNVKYANTDVKVIYDPNEPFNSYELSFMGFCFIKLLILLIITLSIVLPVYFFKLKKNTYFTIDFKNKKIYFGKNNWDEKEDRKLTDFLKETTNPIRYTATQYYLLKNKRRSINSEIIQLKLQECCLNEYILIYHKRIKLNQFDSKYFKRPFFQLNDKLDESSLQQSDSQFLKIFKTKSTLRQHEIHQRLKLLFGLEYESFVENILQKELKNKGYYDNENSLTEKTKKEIKQITKLKYFIDDNIENLIDKNPIELTQLIIYMNSIVLLLSPETFKKLRSFLKNLNEKIPQELFQRLPSYSQNNNYLIPISLLSDSVSFEASYDSFSFDGFDGGDFGGGGAGGDW